MSERLGLLLAVITVARCSFFCQKKRVFPQKKRVVLFSALQMQGATVAAMLAVWSLSLEVRKTKPLECFSEKKYSDKYWP